MFLLDVEKEIVKKINDGSITTIDDYLNNQYKDIKKRQNDRGVEYINLESGISISPGDIIRDIKSKEEENIYIAIEKFYRLCEELRKNELITIDDVPKRKKIIFFVVQEENGEYQPSYLNELLVKYATKLFLPDYQLKQLISNGFKTKNEISYEDEKLQRKKSERWTHRIAIVAIAVPVLTSILTIFGEWFLNYKSKSDKKEVDIVNVKLLDYPIQNLIESIQGIAEPIDGFTRGAISDEQF